MTQYCIARSLLLVRSKVCFNLQLFLKTIPAQLRSILDFHISSSSQIDGEFSPNIFRLRHFHMNTNEKSISKVESQIKGGKSTTDSLKSAVILKSGPKHVFLTIKSQNQGVLYFAPHRFSDFF